MITSDFHMHTAFSTDSETPARAMIEGAIAKGLKTICITDHRDEDYPFYEEMGEHAFLLDVDAYFRELNTLREEYADRIDVRIGIELGLQPHLGKSYQELENKYPFDFVIGSVHVVKGTDPYYGEIFRENSDEKVYRETFRETLEDLKNVEAFDVLGHIDYVVRYGPTGNKNYDWTDYEEIMNEILKI